MWVTFSSVVKRGQCSLTRDAFFPFYQKIWFSFSTLVLNNIALAIEIEGSVLAGYAAKKPVTNCWRTEDPFGLETNLPWKIKIVLLLWRGRLCVICFKFLLLYLLHSQLWFSWFGVGFGLMGFCILLMNLIEYGVLKLSKPFLKKKKKKCQNLCGIFLGMGSSNFSSFTHILDCNLLKDLIVKKCQMPVSSLKIG